MFSRPSIRFSLRIEFKIGGVNVVGIRQFVVALFDDRDFIAIERCLEQRYRVIGKKLRGHGAGDAIAILFLGLAKRDVLNGLDRAAYLRAHFAMARDDV